MHDQIIKDTVRPFRLYNTSTKKFFPHRCYKHLRNSHIGALIEARWGKVGDVIEVVDVTVGKMVGQYRRNLHAVTFTKGGE